MTIRRIAIASCLVVVFSSCGILPWEKTIPSNDAIAPADTQDNSDADAQ